MASPLPETSVLTSRDPALDSNTDEWPEFELHHVHVHRPEDDTNAPTSLLEAAAHHPLVVIGQLQPLSDDLAHLSIPNAPKRRVHVALEEVRMFSYGQYPDGSIAIWAAGKAGWFTLQPGSAYEAVYASMVDAIKTFYFIADSSRIVRKVGKGRSARILPDFTPQELFEKYAEDVLGDATKFKEAASQVYRHKEFIFSCMISGKEGMAWSKLPIYGHLYQRFPDVYRSVRERIHGRDVGKVKHPGHASPSTGGAKRKRARPSKDVSAEDAPIDSSSELKSAQEKAPPAKVAASDTSGSVPSQIPARTPGLTKQNAAKSVPLHVRNMATRNSTPAADEDSDDLPPVRSKSGLRLRSSKAIKSSKWREDSESRPEMTSEEEKVSTEINVAGRRKFGDPAASSRRSSKRRNGRAQADQSNNVLTVPSTGGASPAGSDLISTLEQEISKRTYAPTDPVQEDTWVCPLDGCSHKVYAASNPDGQTLIRAHYALHVYDDDKRVQLVKSLEAPSMPVSHLMEKVRLQAKTEGLPGSRVPATRYPSTIVVQRY